MKKNYNKLSTAEREDKGRIRQQDKIIAKLEREMRNLDTKNNTLDVER
jgi:hypothetical protein